MQLERKNLAFDVKAAEDGSTFEGYAACFHNIDAYGDLIVPGAFAEGLAEFLASGVVAWQHDWSEPIGKPLDAKEDARGLWAQAKISDTTKGRDARTLLKDGVVKKLSIGYRVTGRTWLETAEEVGKYWQEHGYQPTPEDVSRAQYGARLLTKIKLYEFSPVTVPANSQCDITRVKGDLPARLTLDAHSHAVLAAVEEYLTRVKSLTDLRAQEGRSLSPERRAQLKRLRDDLDALLASAAPTGGKAEPQAVLRELARFESTVAALHGVPL